MANCLLKIAVLAAAPSAVHGIQMLSSVFPKSSCSLPCSRGGRRTAAVCGSSGGCGPKKSAPWDPSPELRAEDGRYEHSHDIFADDTFAEAADGVSAEGAQLSGRYSVGTAWSSQESMPLHSCQMRLNPFSLDPPALFSNDDNGGINAKKNKAIIQQVATMDDSKQTKL